MVVWVDELSAGELDKLQRQIAAAAGRELRAELIAYADRARPKT
ncbi:hypothetical protein ACWGN5_25910 [Streptomyces sp. NPDC055815]